MIIIRKTINVTITVSGLASNLRFRNLFLDQPNVFEEEEGGRVCALVSGGGAARRVGRPAETVLLSLSHKTTHN